MEELKSKIGKQIEILKEKIKLNNSKEEIQKEREKLDNLLKEYLKNS